MGAAPASVLRTFLTADVRGYTRFTQEFGDEAAARLATKFAAVAREEVKLFGGEVIELRGDEALAVFASARQALRASVSLQKRFEVETAADAELPLSSRHRHRRRRSRPIRRGLSRRCAQPGPAFSSLAGAGEVLASDLATQLARRTRGLAYVERGLVELKGFADPVRVVRVVDEAEAAIAAAEGPAGTPQDRERF